MESQKVRHRTEASYPTSSIESRLKSKIASIYKRIMYKKKESIVFLKYQHNSLKIKLN